MICNCGGMICLDRIMHNYITTAHRNTTITCINLNNDTDLCRAVANGPVGPAMAGPIIEPVILIFFNLIYFSDRTNNRASHFYFRNLC